MDELSGTLSSLGNLTLPIPLAKELDPETCELLGGFALGVQALMGVLVLGGLLLKRGREKPRRKWRVWLGDVSKQILGQAFVHASNVAISDLIARHKSDNPCSLYALNIAVDTTLGVGILYLFLKALTALALSVQPDEFRTGDYGAPFSMRIWAKQAVVYVAALGLMKVVVVGLFWAVPSLFVLANWCLSWLTSDDAQVVFVMLIFPLVMNLIQFLTIDSILKSKTMMSSPLTDVDDEARRGLFESPDGDDDSDDDDRDELVHPSLKHSTSSTKSLSAPFPHEPRTTVRVVAPASSGSSSSSGGTTPTGGVKTSHSYPPLHVPSSSSSSSSSTNSTPTRAPKRIVPTYGSTSPPRAEESAERSSFEDAWGVSDDDEDEGSLSGDKFEEEKIVRGSPIRIVDQVDEKGGGAVTRAEVLGA